MDQDLNPEFHFDLGSDAQAPWEFAGALAEAEKEKRIVKQTTLDYKIQQRLLANSDKFGKKRIGLQAANRPPATAEWGAATSESEEDSEDLLGEESRDEEAPLPGEEDTGSSGDTSLSVSEKSGAEGGNTPCTGTAAGKTEFQPGDNGRRSLSTAQGNDAERRNSGMAAGLRITGEGYFAETPEETRFEAPSFGDLGLSRPLVKACAALGYHRPTPIQAACIPLALMGRDISGSAITGSGKTAAFALPLLERLLYRVRRIATTYALVLTPTRELAVQVHSMVQRLAQFTDIRVALVVGGLSLQVQAATLRSSPEILVATPGRLIDHLRNTQSVGIEDLQALILDEADRLLEMGFSEEIKEILRLTPRKRQTLLFSATMTEEVKSLAALSLQRPVRLAADPKSAAPELLTQEVVRIKARDHGLKEAILLALCSRSFSKGRTIIFFGTKKRAHRAKMLFGLAGLPPAAELHGDMTQALRLDSLERFRKGEVAFLLATDVAARGLDILGVETVVNYDAPSTLSSYLHRIGRTARAGQAGKSITFVDDDDRKIIKEVVKQQKAKVQERLIPAASYKAWASRIDRLTPDIERLVQEEREERELRKAEMEMQKAENMVQHEAEIFSRPARTWFQTSKDKHESARADKDTRAATQQKRNGVDKQAGKNARKHARAQEAERHPQAKKKQKLMEETESATRNIRSIKAKEGELRLQGVAPSKAGRVAAAQITGNAGTKQRKKAKSETITPLFEGSGSGSKDAAQAVTKVYPGGQRSQKFIAPGGLSKQDRNKLKRQGRGTKSFKSKAKHKRR